MRRRVVITGMGAITPLGHSVDAMFTAQVEGRSGVAPISRFDARRFPTQFAAQVKGFDLGRFVADPSRWRHSGVNSQFAAAAARQALEHSGLLDPDDGRVDRTRFGVYLGSGEGVQDFHTLMSLIARSYLVEERRVDFAAFVRDGLQ